VEESFDETVATVREHKKKSRFETELRQLSSETGDMLRGTAGVAGRAGAFTIDRIRLVTRVVPGMQALQSAGEQAEESRALEEVRQAGLFDDDDEIEFFKTVR